MIILKTLNMLTPGETALIKKIKLQSSMKRRLQDIGCIEGTKIKCLLKSPMGDPVAYIIRGSVFAVREKESKMIIVSEGADNA